MNYSSGLVKLSNFFKNALALYMSVNGLICPEMQINLFHLHDKKYYLCFFYQIVGGGSHRLNGNFPLKDIFCSLCLP